MRHYTTIVSGLLVTAAVLAQPAPSSAAGATRTEFSIVGETAACSRNTYTVQSGSIIEVLQAVTSASGNQMFTMTDATSHVVITDQQGARYSLRGATWFGGATNDSTGAQVITATHNLEVVAPGLGVVDSIRLIERFRDGALISHEFGTCLP